MASSKDWLARSRKPPSVLSLFNMNEKSKFWSLNVLSHGKLLELLCLQHCFY
jgi:hypothetical protein